MKRLFVIFHLFNESTLNSKISIVLILMSFCIIAIVFYLEKKYKKIYKKLYYREEMFSSLCSNVDEVFIIFDIISKKFEYISPNFEKVLGVKSKKLIINPFILLDFIPIEKKEEIKQLFKSKSMNIVEIHSEFNQPITGKKLWMAIRTYPVFNQNTVIRYISSITDITKEMHSQTALKEALLNTQKANDAKKEFLSHMSHELKTPINAIIGMVQIASRSFDDKEKTEDCLKKINTATKNLLAIINNILDMSKIDSNKIILANESFSLSEELTLFSSMMNSQAQINKQEFIFVLHNIQNDLMTGDSLRLNQILGNCLSNSFKFTPQGGKIKLEVSEIEKHANKALFRFIITDNGKGMSEEYIERIFIPFDQEDSEISKTYGGTGLGMSIAKNLIYLMGGNIHVSSKINAGTCITIDIVFSVNQPLPNQVEMNEFKTDIAKYDCTGKRILVVEDNEINMEITSEFLHYIKADVETASNGYEALRLFEISERGYYDVVLMDVQMPGLNGYDTTAAIRNSSHPDANKICIIAMTAYNFADFNSMLDCGMNYHIMKPIDPDEFYSLLQNITTKEELRTD